MKNVKYLGLALMTVCLLSSCGGGGKSGNAKSEPIVVKPAQVQLKGDLSSYFEVVEKGYNINADENSYSRNAMITVELKRIGGNMPFKPAEGNPFGTNGGEKYHYGFGIELLDENGSPVQIKPANSGGMSGPYSNDDLTTIIKLAAGETGYIRWSFSQDEVAKAKSFRITSALEKSSGSVNAQASEETSATDTKKWDDILVSYEKYIDQYIKLYKKAQGGDVSAITEYASMMEKANDLTEKLQGAGDELTAAQAKKFAKLQTKLANAALQ